MYTNDDGIQVEYGFPILPKNVQADISLQVDVWVVDLRRVYNTQIYDAPGNIETSSLTVCVHFTFGGS